MRAAPRLRQLPFALTTLRLLLAPLILAVAYTGQWGGAFIACLVIGFLSDIYDGILARRLGVATPSLRRYDSFADVIFYLAVMAATWVTHADAVRAHAKGIALLAGLELAGYAISVIRFGQPPATHAYSAKLWGILLFATFTALLGFGYSGWLASATIAVGCIADIEIIAILLVSRAAALDVPTLFHAMRWRRVTATHSSASHSAAGLTHVPTPPVPITMSMGRESERGSLSA